MKILATNKEINYKYEVIESLICGIALKGTEVKSIREGKVNIKDGFVVIKNSQMLLKNVHISHYENGNINNVDEKRDRVLLANKREINKLIGAMSKTGYTLIPYKVGLEKQYVKFEIALCKGKKIYDKRESIKKKEDDKRIEQAFRKDMKNG